MHPRKEIETLKLPLLEIIVGKILYRLAKANDETRLWLDGWDQYFNFTLPLQSFQKGYQSSIDKLIKQE